MKVPNQHIADSRETEPLWHRQAAKLNQLCSPPHLELAVDEPVIPLIFLRQFKVGIPIIATTEHIVVYTPLSIITQAH